MNRLNHTNKCLLLAVLLMLGQQLHAQYDSTRKNTIDSFLNRPRGILGQLAQTLLADTSEPETALQRADQPFRRYEGRIIRNISITPLKFGVWSGDTSSRFDQKLAQVANYFHHRTRGWVTRNQLFFHEGEKLSAYLMGNNERYLRDLPFFQGVHFVVKAVRGSRDSVDVFVVTKDVLSLGGGLTVYSANSALVSLKEDNLNGWGDKVEVETLFDNDRKHPFGFGAEYLKRNILGTFVDGNAGYVNFDNTFNTGRAEEKLAFIRFVRPLVNPFMKWTYAVTFESHATSNMFGLDSIYFSDWQYRYRVYDAWAAYNFASNRQESSKETNRLRFLISGRVFDQNFLRKPLLYREKYYYAYADESAILGALSLFKLNFYKTQYVYGFGRKEDLPEGLDASLTSGFTNTEGRKRLYTAINFQQYFLSAHYGYFNYSLMGGSYFYHMRAEDISMLANMDYFSPLNEMGSGWKNRSFLNFSFAKEFRMLMGEPVLLESKYGLNDFNNNGYGGSLRATLKAESVFFSPWSLLFFRFAPFVFSSATLFKMEMPVPHGSRIYTAFGGGLRTRNESLVFGTIELRATYFPTRDVLNNSYRIDIHTNLRYKYNQNFIKRPEFVGVN